MNKELATEAIAALDVLVERAIAIVSKAPYWVFIPNDTKFAKLRIRGNGVTVLFWPTIETQYDFSTIEREEVTFPTRLLFITDDELATWKSEQQRKCEREEARRTREQQLAQEVKERAEFERLKALYG